MMKMPARYVASVLVLVAYVTILSLAVPCVAADYQPSGPYVTLAPADIHDFILIRQSSHMWPYAQEAGRALEQPGLAQSWAPPDQAPTVSVTTTRFPDEKLAGEAVRFYAGYMAMPFAKGALPGCPAFGEDCWHTDEKIPTAVVFHRGPFCFVVGVPGVKPEDRTRTISEFAKALDDKATATIEGKISLESLPPANNAAVTSIRADVLRAIHEGNIPLLVNFATFVSAEETRLILDFLAQSPKGCEALGAAIEKLPAPKQSAAVDALRRSGAPEAREALQTLARSTKNGALFEECASALLRGLSEPAFREMCLEEVQKLAETPDASPRKLAFYMNGLGRTDKPREVTLLRQILANTRDENIRATALIKLADWIKDDAESRRTVLATISEHVHDRDKRVRMNALIALGKSGDLRNIVMISSILDDPDNDIADTAAVAIAQLLDEQISFRDTPLAKEHFVKDTLRRVAPIVELLKSIEATIKSQREPPRKG